MPRTHARTLALTTGLASLVSLATSTGCVHPRDFQAKPDRITRNSAYAEHSRVRVDTDLLAGDADRFVLNAGVTVAAVRDRLDFTVNLAHGAVGVVNVQSKFTMVDTRWYGLGGRVGLTYVNPTTFYFLPRETRDTLGQFNLMSVPIELWQSVPVNHWFAFHLGMGYRSTALWGQIDNDDLFVDTSLAQRSFVFWPYVNFFAGRRVAFQLGSKLPAFTQVVEATAAETEIEEGVIAGVQSVEWIRRPITSTAQIDVGIEVRFGVKTFTHMRLGVNVWAFRPLDQIPVTPTFNLHWRFK